LLWTQYRHALIYSLTQLHQQASANLGMIYVTE